MYIVIAPDKFKGSLSSFDVCDAIESGVKIALPNARIEKFPMADGGDGFASVIKYYTNSSTIHCATQNAIGRAINANYEWDEVNCTAIIELASASGLAQLFPQELDALNASTYGSGIMINDAIRRGAKKIILGLGGSATTDAGTGILSALGFIFLDADDNAIKPCGGNLHNIAEIIPPNHLAAVKFSVACDVDNPLFGAEGAAYTYAAQKGASIPEVEWLDEGLRHIASVFRKYKHADIAHVAGSGAAGGVAAGLMAFFPVKIMSGIQMVAEASGIKQALPTADVLITGEGKMDRQTLQGKVVQHLAALAHQHQVSTIAVCGVADDKELMQHALNLKAIVTLVSADVSKEEAMENGYALLKEKIATVFSLA